MIAFFNASIGIADPNSNIAPNEVPLYSEKKQLSTELVKYMSRELRPRYKEVMSNFYDKYEQNFSDSSASTDCKRSIVKPQDIKQRIDEIAKRRAELKKLAKKEEIDRKLKPAEVKEKEPEEEVEPAPNDAGDKACVV